MGGAQGFYEVAEARSRNCVRGAGAKTAMRWGSLFLRDNVGEGGATGGASVEGSGGFLEIFRRAWRGCDRRGEGLRTT